MIGIITKSGNEYSTDEVIDWVHHLGSKFKRITPRTLNGITKNLVIGGEPSDELKSLKNVRALWFRRWGEGPGEKDENSIASDHLDCDKKAKLESIIRTHYQDEMRKLSSYFFYLKNHATWLNPEGFHNINKLIVLDIAKENGLDIPPSLITDDKKVLKDFIDIHVEVITKPLSESIVYSHDDETLFTMYTELITQESVNDLPDTFASSLFQKRIDKEFEIRSFFLNDQFYSMAIFSQNNPKTEVDFRHYDHSTPNRTQCFVLPKGLEIKLRNLMKSLNLVTGSIDILKGKDDKYYFLEVNPVGQFGMVSKPCRYNIEKKIAEYLKDQCK